MQRRCDHSAQRLRLEEERWEAQQEEKKDALYSKMDAEAEAVEKRYELNVRLLREQYETKKQAGTLSSEDETRYQGIFAKAEEFFKLPRVRYRYGHFYHVPGKSESDWIKPNTNGNSHPSVWA